MIENSKVRSSHTRRAAIVYIRQSHPSQVENNRESTARQYALVEKAMALGWDRSQVTTIDEDLGTLLSGYNPNRFSWLGKSSNSLVETGG